MILIEKALLEQALEALQNCANGEDDVILTGETLAALRKALEQPEPPPECKTEAEKIAYAFGWWKALEAQRNQSLTDKVIGWTDTVQSMFNDIQLQVTVIHKGTGVARSIRQDVVQVAIPQPPEPEEVK